MSKSINELPLEDIRIIHKREVMRLTGWSAVTLYRRTKAGEFPEPRRDGNRAVWFEHEVREAMGKLFQPGPCTNPNLPHLRKA